MDVAEIQGGAEASGIRLVGHSDLDGQGDGMHVNIKDGIAYIGHMGESRIGTSVVDVSDPERPQVVDQIETPVGTHSHKVQVVGDVMLVNYERNHREPDAESWEAGIKVFDVSTPSAPSEIAFYRMPGVGVHRMTYWEPPFAYMSGSDEGYTDQFLIILDLSDPSSPVEAGRWWFPGMFTAGGETPDWDPNSKRVALHHPILRGDRAYCGFWDAGLVILDVSDVSHPKLVSHVDFGSDVSRCTHSAVPIPGRDLLVVVDEETVDDCAGIQKQVRVVDIEDESRPKVLSLFPVPEGDFCQRGGRFGPHNVHEMRPGTLSSSDTIYLTYFNAGLRVVDISDARNPIERAHFVPPAPPGRRSIQFNDVLVDEEGLIYATDRFTGGLYILELT